MIKPQDIIVALNMCQSAPFSSYAEKALALGMSASEVHAAERRLVESRLLNPMDKSIQKKAFLNFLVHGVPYAFAVAPKEMTRGMPTAWAAPALANQFAGSNQPIPVWPDPNGDMQGVAIKPLYRSAPQAARNNPELYELLALVDALRTGRARERKLAEKLLEEKLKRHATA
ncbi:hypothetical protein QEH59_18600 [Coraliomargarita sp. SDUM461004]|uniref:Transcriptional regulator n=1 Tax=Thalassobacterium sedimentorum TaxID=3041258 RepID=A0ABU1ARQ0_9BACT|nr:hypothetical protein [Coraliomargarita sp. SDUM461004]MDQ8196446.1 hypothetical protein [Coraliomargarita sp. SDUM461004]